MHNEVLDIMLQEVEVNKDFHVMPSGELAKQAFCSDIIKIKECGPQEYMHGAVPKNLILGVHVSDATGYNPAEFGPIIQISTQYKNIRDVFILPMIIPENGRLESCKMFDVVLLVYIYKEIESIEKTFRTIDPLILDVAAFGLREFFGKNILHKQKSIIIDEETSKLLDFTSDMLKGC